MVIEEPKPNSYDKNLTHSKEYLQELFNHMSSGVVVYEVKDGGRTFVIKDMNAAGVKSCNVDKNDIINKNLLEIFPGVKDLGLYDVFQRVWKTGKSARYPSTYYKDHRISGWVENYVFKLPSGDIVAIFDDITEKVSAEEKLKKLNEGLEQKIQKRTKELNDSEAKFRLIIESANDLIAILDQDFKHEYINKHYESILGYSKEELIGTHPISIVHPDDIKKAMKTTRIGIKKGKASVDLRYRHKNGHVLWFEMKGSYFKDVNGVYKSLVISRDITERKIAEQKLRESEEKYRNLINNISDVIFELDMNNKFTYISPQIFDTFGYHPEELIGKNVFTFIKPDDISNVKNTMEQAENSEKVLTLQGNACHKEGYYIPVSARGKVYNYMGKKRHLVLLRDVSKIKEAEQKIIDSEEKHRLISENTDDLIAVYNMNFEIEYLNESAHSKILGYEPSKFKKPSFRFSLVHKEDLEKVAPLFKNSFKRGNYKVQFRIRHKKGNYLWFETKGKIYTDKDGIKKLLLVSRDITEIKKVEEKLNEINQIKTELLRRASHELKTPLVSIYSAAEFLLNAFQDHFDEHAKEFIEIIQKGGERLKILVENLLDVSQLEDGRLKLKRQKEVLGKIINNCIQDIKFYASERDITIEFQPSENYYANIDKIRFEQVILNLLSNAIKYTPPNGTVSIYIEKLNENYIDIIFKDTGLGFTEEEKLKVFTKFGKIERYGKGYDINPGGTGLGLFISKEIVELHGAKIWVESEGRDKGSKFIIRLYQT